MEERSFKKYIILWLSQGISGLGSSMTGFALVLWAYGQSHSAMSVSLMSFCNYVPYVFLSLFVGGFIDRHKKKTIMLVSDSIAAAGSLAVLVFLLMGSLEVWNIYAINAVVGITNAFQQPASAVATGRLVPKEKISNVSGMNSFSNNLIVVFSPMLAAFLFAAGGLPLILLIDLASFAFAFCVLLFCITIPEQAQDKAYSSPFAGIAQGFDFLKKEKGILYIMLTMALINFCSRLTYENILSPMILARSSGDSAALGIVNACMGAGGIAGGIFVSVKKESRYKTAAIYVSAALSFLFGDLMMAVGKNVFGGRLLRLLPACLFHLSWQTRIRYCTRRFLQPCRGGCLPSEMLFSTVRFRLELSSEAGWQIMCLSLLWFPGTGWQGCWGGS